MELHFETTIEREYSAALDALRREPADWLPDVRATSAGLTTEIGAGAGARRISRRVRIEVGSVQPFGHGVAVPLDWQEARHPDLYPRLHGVLRLEQLEELGQGRCRLRFDAFYRPPAGSIGEIADSVMMNRVAQASVQDFFDRVVEVLAQSQTPPAAGEEA